MVRPNDMMIPASAKWLTQTDSRAVCDAIMADGHSIYFVGGCVRNALLGRGSTDIDLSTDAHPEQVIALAGAAGLKAIPTGVDHGTVTVVSGGIPFEITTFRHDIETNGRHAVVAFSGNIDDDARRRDFTMNALYARPDGVVIDPLGGLPDLLAGRVRFIENADMRISEDYLRSLRFFRFHAWYADPDQGLDPDALDAIARNLDGLKTLSAERVGAEMIKLLSAPDPGQAVAAMRQTGVLQVLLPGADDRWLGPVTHLEDDLGLACDWQLRLAALGGQDTPERLRLSNTDAAKIAKLTQAAYGAAPLPEIAYRDGLVIARGALILRAAMADSPPDPGILAQLDRAAQATFPVRAADLMPTYQGPALGARIATLKTLWIASDFTMTRDELLRRDE